MYIANSCMRNLKFIFTAVLFVALISSCKKEAAPEIEVLETPTRNSIDYLMTVNPRAENKVGDTILVKVNGAIILNIKGSVADTYGPYKVKTGDVVSVRYYPGKVTLNNGTTSLDENGLRISLDYNINNNITLVEYGCRCIADFSKTLE